MLSEKKNPLQQISNTEYHSILGLPVEKTDITGASRFATPVAISLDICEYNTNPDFSLARLNYRGGTLAPSLAVGSAVGGPAGTVAGGVVGGLVVGFEYVYDNMIYPLMEMTASQFASVEIALRNGWRPGY